MNELPFMSFFVNDTLAEVAELDARERGAYFTLQFAAWKEGGPLLYDARRLARLAGVENESWPSVWAAIGRFFDLVDGRLHHPRVDAEIERAREMQDARRRGAAATNAQRRAQRTQSDPSSEARTAQRTETEQVSDTLSVERATRSAHRSATKRRSAGRSTLGNPSPSPSPSPSQNPHGDPERSPPLPGGSVDGGAEIAIRETCPLSARLYDEDPKRWLDRAELLVIGRATRLERHQAVERYLEAQNARCAG